jgi:hypothetical protein
MLVFHINPATRHFPVLSAMKSAGRHGLRKLKPFSPTYTVSPLISLRDDGLRRQGEKVIRVGLGVVFVDFMPVSSSGLRF